MQDISRTATLHRLSRHLVALALVAAATLLAGPAQAGPYSLCASLLNSSLPGRTLESGCAGMEPHTDPSAVSVTLSSSDFGSFEGTASASSDAFDNVRLYVNVALTNYRTGSYVEESPGTGIPFAGSAFATYRDVVTVSGPSLLARVEATFGVSGLLEWNGVAAQLCYSFAFGGPLGGGPCLVEQTLPPKITVTSQLFPVNSTQELNFSFNAVVFVADANFPDGYTKSAIADLGHTITLEQLLVTDAGGAPIQGIALGSEGGFNYPLSALNQVPAVPEPGQAALLAAGGLMLAAMRRRRAPRG